MTARDLAEQMARLADLLGEPRDTPWPQPTALANERIEQREITDE